MAQSHFDSQIIELKDTIATLNSTMKMLQKSLDSTQASLDSTRAALDEALAREEGHIQEITILKEQVSYLTHKLYGSSSEKRKAPIEGQLSIFNEAEIAVDDTDGDDPGNGDGDTEVVTFTRKKKATKEQKFSGLPVIKKIIDIPENERFCNECGSPLNYVGEKLVRKELDFIPAKVRVIEYYRKSYECRQCKKVNKIPHIIKGYDGEPRMIHAMASASTVAYVIYQKYFNSMPLYRQEKDWRLYGCDLSRATMASWIIKNSEEFFKPMWEFFREHICSQRHAMADETPLQVLREKGRTAQSKSYMWVFRTGEYLDKQAIVYQYKPTRAGHVADEFFKNFKGYLMCDGFSGYNAVSNVTRTGCWAHARRYLLDAVPAKDRTDYSLPAMQGVMYIDKLFELEKKIHKRKQSADSIKERRLRDETPVLEGLWSWLEKQSPRKGSKFYKAVTYLRNQRPYLEAYLEDGFCSFSNNASERCCKDFVVGRKNWLFADSEKGADASSYAYSIVQTAKANDVNVYHYLCFLLEKAPSSMMTSEQLCELAPWNDDVKAEIKKRERESML